MRKLNIDVESQAHEYSVDSNFLVNRLVVINGKIGFSDFWAEAIKADEPNDVVGAKTNLRCEKAHDRGASVLKDLIRDNFPFDSADSVNRNCA